MKSPHSLFRMTVLSPQHDDVAIEKPLNCLSLSPTAMHLALRAPKVALQLPPCSAEEGLKSWRGVGEEGCWGKLVTSQRSVRGVFQFFLSWTEKMLLACLKPLDTSARPGYRCSWHQMAFLLGPAWLWPAYCCRLSTFMKPVKETPG